MKMRWDAVVLRMIALLFFSRAIVRQMERHGPWTIAATAAALFLAAVFWQMAEHLGGRS